ncbi:MAG: dienelactone hydrolase family protein, partial [Acidobacteria bacterium]
MRTLTMVMMLALGASVASAEVRTKVVEYTQGNTALEGFL